MKRITGLALAIALSLVAMVQADSKTISAVGVAAAHVTCTLPAAPTANNASAVAIRSFYVTCGKASGATTEMTVTVTGLAGGTPTYYLDQSTTLPTQMMHDYGVCVPATNKSTNIVVDIPATTNGGPCSCTATGC